MQSILLSCLFCVTLMQSTVDCSRTPKPGHIMLNGISLESNDFERQVIQVANQIEQLQIRDETQPDPSIQQYILPVFLYVHEATRISQSPVYLGLNVQPSSSHGQDYRNYLQIVDIYDERYYQPISQTSPLTTFTYPNKITPFNPTYELDRDYVIDGLQDSKKKYEVITRLSLVFVESIRFYSVRRTVQQALQMKTVVDFNVHMQVIRDWEAMTNRLVFILQTKKNFIQADQNLDPSLTENVFSVSVFHLNAATQVNMWFLYQFIRCNNEYHQQTQDGDGSCDVDVWSETKWKIGCSNVNGRDVAVRQMTLESCAQMCQRTMDCTHFSWKKNECYLKTGGAMTTDQKLTYDLRAVCGYKRQIAKDDVSDFTVELNSAYDDQNDASHVSAESAADCYNRCHRNDSCKTFTWHEKETTGGDCYLQSNIGESQHGAEGYISGRRAERNIISKGLNRFRRANQIGPGGSGTLRVTSNSGQDIYVPNRYGWSAHNCNHHDQKTGLVFYPSNTKYKNIVLLMCHSCYDYKQSNSGTQHEQLHHWYYRLYGESKSYSLVSGFSQKHDGSLGFNSYSQNGVGRYTDNSRTMNSFEQNVVQRVVNGKLEHYVAT